MFTWALKSASSTECLALDYALLGGNARGPEMATLFLDFGHSGSIRALFDFLMEVGTSLLKILIKGSVEAF